MNMFIKILLLATGGFIASYLKKMIDTHRILIIKDNDYDIHDFDDDIKESENYIKDSIINLKPENYNNAMDLRGAPTHVCACGSNVWNLKVCFEENQISSYFLDMECVNCGSVATAPTPIDRENQ